MSQEFSLDELLRSLARGGRRRPAPSARNQQIAEEVRVGGRTQADVAAQHGLSQVRVSQICRQVERWEGQSSPNDRGQLHGEDRQHARQALQERQLAEIYARAMRGHARSQQPLVTTREGTRADGSDWSEKCQREQKSDTASLRLALRAVELSRKWAAEQDPWEDEGDRRPNLPACQVVDVLCGLRLAAEKQGLVPEIKDRVISDSYLRRKEVERCLRELLTGARKEGAAGGEAPVTAAAQQSGGGSFNSFEPDRQKGASAAASAAEGDGASVWVERDYIDSAGRAHLLTEGQAPPENLVDKRGAAEGVQEGEAREGEAPAEPGQEPEDRRQRTEDGGQKTEDGACSLSPSHSHTPVPPHSHTPTPSHAPTGPQHARWQLEYAFGQAMSDADIAAALAHQRRVDRGQYVMNTFDRQQVAALRAWESRSLTPSGTSAAIDVNSATGPSGPVGP